MIVSRITFRLAVFVLGLCGLVSSASAASSDWAVNEGGRMRLILLAPDESGDRQGALVIEPQPGWVTYWKEPGDVGIPPSLTVPPGAPYAVEHIAFPVPKLLDAGDIRDVGYDAPVVLPLTLSGSTADMPVTLHAFIGVCLNICIPFQADLTVAPAVNAATSAEEQALIADARRKLPQAPSPEFSVKQHVLQPDLKQFDVTLTIPPSATPPSFFLRGPSGFVFVKGTFTTTATGDTQLSIPIRKLPKNYKPSGKTWDLLVVAGERAMETTLTLE
ncbi:protein-disulfide reductase DsbD domain-containing protein [Rhizobium sp. G187]|uniref:protein-disulfide reductase DsbD domain-containing protein n=1 Tax=Rhizobium sp. G187 TaxID=3451352 RepID=UPI003EE5977E